MRTAAFALLATLALGTPARAGGQLDTTFGTDGAVTTEFGGAFDRIEQLTIDPLGRILGIGTGGSQNRCAVARYLPDGQLDASFSLDGRLIISFDFSSGGPGLLATPDGKLLMALGLGSPRDFALLRLLDDGRLDPNFGTGGEVRVPGDQQARIEALVRQPDGKLVVGGYDFASATSNWDWVLTRFTATGEVDTSFGTNGKVVIDFSRPEITRPIDFLVSLTALPDGRLLAGGLTSTTAAMSTGNRIYAMARVLPNGDLDPNFADGGKHVFSFAGGGAQQENISSLLQLPDGRILAASGGGSETALIRFLRDGSIDTTFGSNGRIVAPAGAAYRNPLEIQFDTLGGILGCGAFAVTRFFPDGSVDTAFGSNGTASYNWGTPQQGASSLVQNPDGAIIVAGYSGFANVDYDWSLVRFTPAVECVGDVDGDGDVDFEDLLVLLLGFGMPNATPEIGDVDRDRDVDTDDLLLLLGRFGSRCD